MVWLFIVMGICLYIIIKWAKMNKSNNMATLDPEQPKLTALSEMKPKYNFKDTPQYIEFELMKDKFAELMAGIGQYFKMCEIDSDALLNSAQVMANSADNAAEIAMGNVIRFTELMTTASEVKMVNHCLSQVIYNLYQLQLLQLQSSYKNDNLIANNIIEVWSKRELFMSNALSNLIQKEEKSLLKLRTVKGRENRAYNLNETRTFSSFAGFVPDDTYEELINEFAVRNNLTHIL